jgi:aromatic-L-amino-acid/L-tryptophan decarboxylase
MLKPMSISHLDQRHALKEPSSSLDPEDWSDYRMQGHRMLDDMFDFLQNVRTRPVWQPIPSAIKASIQETMPREPSSLDSVYTLFQDSILPYGVGNIHPGFMGWVHGGGTAVGMLAEMLAAGLNANLGGREQMPVEVEKQIVQWMRALFDFPQGASGLFVTGTSMANFISLLVARTAALGTDVRQTGLAQNKQKLVAYCSSAAHGCISQAMDLAGMGIASLHIIAVNQHFQLDTQALRARIHADRQAGLTPFFIAATAGTVDVGAVDDLTAISEIARAEHIWFHVDGAYGALGMLSQHVAPKLQGIQQADSIAFDFHKWGQVPYDAGFVLIRDGDLHQATFTSPAAYLGRSSQGMAAGSPWPCDFGPDLSRGFRALKTWFTFKVYGADKIGQVISQTCTLAQQLKSRIEASAELELLAPVTLNIVCFRFRLPEYNDTASNRLNDELIIELQKSGLVAPSSTTLNGRTAIRAAIVNHRSNSSDIDTLVTSTIKLGHMLMAKLKDRVTQ